MWGIALVVDDITKGQKLAFRYPAPPGGRPADEPDSLYGPGDDLFAKMFRPKPGLCNKVFELVVDELRFISFPLALPAECQTEITLFNVVFTLGADTFTRVQRPDAALPHERCIPAYKRCVERLARALEHEERRAGYVSQQVREMLQAREMVLAARARGDHSMEPAALVDMVLARSSLARELRTIFHDLSATGAASLAVNQWVRLSLTLFDPSMHPSGPIRPYHTLLLLEDEAKVLSVLPRDCAPPLRRLVRAASPVRSFQELQAELGVPAEQLFRLAAHLVFWRQARVVQQMTKNSMYTVAPSACLCPSCPLAQRFAALFPRRSLPETLARFSAARRLRDHMKRLAKEEHSDFVVMVAWLLRNDCLVELHSYVYVLISAAELHALLKHPSTAPTAVATVAATVAASTAASAATASTVATPAPPTAAPTASADAAFVSASARSAQRAARARADAAHAEAETEFSGSVLAHELATYGRLPREGPLYELFHLLLPYFHGQHHVQEIMWRENLRREEVYDVLRAYKDIVSTCLHADSWCVTDQGWEAGR